MSNKILVTGTSVRPEHFQSLINEGYIVDNPTNLLSEEELSNALGSSAAYLLGGDEYATRHALSSAKDLKVIAFLGMGYESFIDVPATKELKIAVTNTPGTLSNAVAEFTIGLLLNASRKIALYASQYASGTAGKEEKQHDLAARHVGLIGLGGIGTRIAEILRNGFGTQVSYSFRTRKQHLEERLSLEYRSLDDLTQQADVLIVMVPKTPDTEGLIGMRRVSSFKPGTILVNTARPEIVDPAALLTGLEKGQVEYAAFDGFYEGPSEVVQQLKSLTPTKLLITGHIASLTHEARDGMAKKAIQSILNILKTGKDACIVNGSNG